MNIKLLGDRALIQVPEETKTTSGLLIAKENDASSFKKGIVVAVGRGKRDEIGVTQSLEAKIGDEVLFSYGEPIEVEGKKYFLVKESDIAMVINIKGETI